MKRLITTIFLSGIFLISCSQEKKHPIDIEMERCLKISKNQTTAGMANCAHQAHDKWDAEMNKYYQLLMDTLSESEKTKLRESQRKWIAYRNAEFNFAGEYFAKLQGTMYIVISAGNATDFVKNRALELKSYYDMKTQTY